MKVFKYLAVLLLIFFSACSSLVLKPINFSWPVESVLNVGNNGNVQAKRYSISFNAKKLFLKETGDSLGYQNKQLNIIRNNKGYYFMVAGNFKNVYVFKNSDGLLKLKKKIEISDSTGIQNPAFNQRPPYIELTYGRTNNKKLYLTDNGIVKESDKKLTDNGIVKEVDKK